MKGRVLIVAGSDSGGGAGIQADIKAVTALDAYAATAITALTAQDTHGVHGIHAVPADFVRLQMTVVLDDLGADAIKTGMLHDSGVIEVVAATLAAKAADVPLVVDPVMVAKGGAMLLRAQAVAALRRHLIPRAAVITPNRPEAEALLGRPIAREAEAEEAARALLDLGCGAVLLKGGHAEGPVIRDILVSAGGMEVFERARIETRHTHGTGCTLASALAAGLAQGLGLSAAVRRARAYVHEAIRTAPGLGGGHGPLNHAHTVTAFTG